MKILDRPEGVRSTKDFVLFLFFFLPGFRNRSILDSPHSENKTTYKESERDGREKVLRRESGQYIQRGRNNLNGSKSTGDLPHFKINNKPQ